MTVPDALCPTRVAPILCGWTASLKMLIQAGGPELLMLTDEDGWSCAHVASQNGQVEALKMLIEAGGKELLMLTTKDGKSCAYMASRNGHAEALGVLIKAGGKELLMLTDEGGRSCAYLASQNGHAEVLKVLIQGGQGAADADGRGRQVVCAHGFFSRCEDERGGSEDADSGGGHGSFNAKDQFWYVVH